MLPFPAYRFVPGRHPHPTRDPRGHSFGAPELVGTLSPDAWNRCEPYLFAIDLFNHRYWWEAHEALEPFWRGAGRDSRDGRFLQGLIQVAAALLRQSMGSGRAARDMAETGCAKLRGAPSIHFGIDVPTFVDNVEAFFSGKGDEVPVIRLRDPLDPVRSLNPCP